MISALRLHIDDITIITMLAMALVIIAIFAEYYHYCWYVVCCYYWLLLLHITRWRWVIITRWRQSYFVYYDEIRDAIIAITRYVTFVIDIAITLRHYYYYYYIISYYIDYAIIIVACLILLILLASRRITRYITPWRYYCLLLHISWRAIGWRHYAELLACYAILLW